MASTPFQFAELLGQYVQRAGYTPGQLNRLSSVPKMTIRNWLQGRVQRPRVWSDLLRLAAALHLNEAEATALLQAAGHPAIVELLQLAGDQEQDLLAPWAATVRSRHEHAPFQVVADLPYFVGREPELDALRQALLADHHPAVYVLEGMAGVGKTALAARLVYQVRPHFPDGVLWARLDTTDPMSILSAFASAYGRDVSGYLDLHSRSQVVREVLAHKRALVILDNARSSQEIEPFVPPTGPCAVVITTRRHDLAATRGMRRFAIGPFHEQRREAHDLFARLLGPERAQREQAALDAIAELLGYLPLAIAIAASRLAYELDWLASDFFARLRQERQRLNELAYEDQSVRSSFNLSYDLLPPAQQRSFAALGVFDGEDFDVEAVASVTETPLDRAQDQLRRLYGLSLVQQGRPGRYRLHPLLRDYAREHIRRSSVFERMVAFFVRYAEDHRQAYDRLDRESSNILAALRIASERAMPALLLRGVDAFYRFLEVRGLYGPAESYLHRAYEAASSLGDTAGLAAVLLGLGRISERRGEYARAEDYLQEGLVLARRVDDRERVCALLTDLGVVVCQRGEYARGETYAQEALACARMLEDSDRICILLTNLGVAARRRGDYVQAEAYYQEGLALARAVGHRESLSLLLANLSALAGQRGEYAQAERYLQEGLVLAREIGHRDRISLLLTNLGLVAFRRGAHALAQGYLHQALVLARDIGHRERECMLLLNLAEIGYDHGDTAGAEAHMQEGLALARRIGHRWLIAASLNSWGELCLAQCRWDAAGAAFREAQELGVQEYVAAALYGLARVTAARGDPSQARCEGQQSLTLYQASGHPKAAEVARWLAELPV